MFNKVIHLSFFLVCLLTSYFLGLAFYDATKGLDYGKYFLNVKFFMGEQVQLIDGNGSLYYYLISKAVGKNNIATDQENLNIIINNSIQSINFLFFIFGLIGLYIIFKKKNFKTVNILYSFSILSFLPTAFYFRLTMKPEAMAFGLLPWTIYFLDNYFKKKTFPNIFFSVLTLSTLLTIKGSITGMTLICLVYLYRDKIFKNHDFKVLVLLSSVTSGAFIFINKTITNLSVFSNNVTDLTNSQRWNNTAGLSFFTNIDFKNLLENPYQYIHSDSFISIILLDTLSDYFRFFWQHQEETNYISFGQVQFTNNFLIQRYLPQYSSIIFSAIFYSLILILVLKNEENKEYLLMPIFGISVLVLNSLGFPNNNFDPTTGDLFKVHYYSYLVAISFFTLLLITFRKYRLSKYFCLLLIPIFLYSIGFPKTLSPNTEEELYNKISKSELCFIIQEKDKVNC